jgi:transcriptional regulator with XRE-family HTH domain
MPYASSVSESSDEPKPPPGELPNVGEIILRLRLGRGLSLQDLAERTGLSPSFLSAVERGRSDIALRRLARIADAFGHDVGSLLGYTARRAKPMFLDGSHRRKVDRGPGVEYQQIALPGVDFELVAVDFAPGASPPDEMSHGGFDIVYVTSGVLTLVYNDISYRLPTGTCALYSSGYPHLIRNDTKSPASLVGVATEAVY